MSDAGAHTDPTATAYVSRETNAAAPRPYCIFISYGRHDKPLLKAIAPELEVAGAEILTDNGIECGEDFRQRIFADLERAHELCVLLTPTSIERPWIFAEIGVALHRKIKLAPIVYGDEARLREKGILSLLGTNLYLTFDEVERYVEQVKIRIARHRHA